MAGDTIGIIGDAFFQVDLAHFSFGMGVAVSAGVFHIVPEMAGLAGNFPFVAVIEREAVGVQFGRCPGGGAVAKLTLQTKLPGVDGGFLVAVDTGARCLLKLLSGVATLAGSFKMCPIQDKNQVVVEVTGFAAPLVAFQAGCAEEVGVFGHKNGIGLDVAGLAIYGFDSVNRSFVAIIAGHFRAIEVGLVGHEAEAGEAIMVELAEGHLGDLRVAPGMVGVTGLAAGGVYQMTVQPVAALALGGDGGVAFFTFGGSDAPPGGVAEGTLLFKFGVGSETGEWGLSRPCLRQMSGAKRAAAAPDQNHTENHHEQYGCATAKAGKERVSALIGYHKMGCLLCSASGNMSLYNHNRSVSAIGVGCFTRVRFSDFSTGAG